MGEKEKWSNKENDKQQHADSLLHNTSLTCPTFVPNYKILGAVVPEKSLTKKNLERKKNEEIKGQISSSSLILVYTTHQPIDHMCTKSQLCRPHSS